MCYVDDDCGSDGSSNLVFWTSVAILAAVVLAMTVKSIL
jgi:hypothetical protein